MGKGRDRRRRARGDGKHRDAGHEHDALEPRAVAISCELLTAADRSRALARFRSLRGRGGARFAFVLFGPIVSARDPNELEAQVLCASDALQS
jgi:hypothetical protein